MVLQTLLRARFVAPLRSAQSNKWALAEDFVNEPLANAVGMKPVKARESFDFFSPIKMAWIDNIHHTHIFCALRYNSHGHKLGRTNTEGARESVRLYLYFLLLFFSV